MHSRLLLSGNEAVALAAIDGKIEFGAGYPGTPSTEILENFSKLGGRAQWSVNEKVALEVALGAAFAGARAITTMKHVGLNVAADPLFSAAYSGVAGALLIVSADDPGMASSQNEQDNRYYARFANLPMLEPSDSQEAYDYTLYAIKISERWKIPVILRLTTRVCHSVCCLQKNTDLVKKLPDVEPNHKYQKDVRSRVLMPVNARPAHQRLLQKLEEIAQWNETSELNQIITPEKDALHNKYELGIITSGISYVYAREAAPQSAFLKLGMTWPLPKNKIMAFIQQCKSCYVIEEGERLIEDSIRSYGINVHGKSTPFICGELNVARVRKILKGDASPETPPPPGRAPRLCPGCPHTNAFEVLRDLKCIVAGDIGCYTLGTLPPYDAMDTCICMGASITNGLGLRYMLTKEEARRVVSVIGDSTFFHSGITGIVEMVYNPSPTGHIVLILDNETTAMTGLQEHPGSGKNLMGKPAKRILPEEIVKAIGVDFVKVFDPVSEKQKFKETMESLLEKDENAVIILRRSCLLATKKRQKANNG